MKPFFSVIPVVMLLASCASKPTPRIVPVIPEIPGRTLQRGEAASVRLPEKIKAYPLGRYADPHHRGIMHEAHTLYRVESSPKWNLARPAGPSSIPTSAAASSKPSESELTVELNRQRQATQAVIHGGRIVSGKLAEMTASLQRNQKALDEQNADIRKELQATRERLETLEKKVDERSAPEAAPLSDDDPW